MKREVTEVGTNEKQRVTRAINDVKGNLIEIMKSKAVNKCYAKKIDFAHIKKLLSL